MKGFSLLLNKVVVAASKPKEKRNKTGFILYAYDLPSLNSRAKTKIKFNFFSSLGLIALKTLNKIYEKTLYSVGFTQPALKFATN